MDRFLPIVILVAFALVGFVLKRRELNQLSARIDSVTEYRDRFIDLINSAMKNGEIDGLLYIELTEKAVAMQRELGLDGIMAFVIDPLKGISDRNHQMLINFLPEIRTIGQWYDNPLMMERFISCANYCDDMFLRHHGLLEDCYNSKVTSLMNPFSCLAEGVRGVLRLPGNILLWCGFIPEEVNCKLRGNWFVKLLAIIVTTFGLIASGITLVLGWEQFSLIIVEWFR